MIYTAKEKQKIEEMLAAFQGCIEASGEFDIVFSPKIGYLQLWIKHPGEGAVLMHSAEELLRHLVQNVINEVLYQTYDDDDISREAALAVIQEAQRRIAPCLAALGDNPAYTEVVEDCYAQELER